MKISVIVPMYNASQSIERCLDSIRIQTYRCGYEIIAINDGSTDNTLSVVEQYAAAYPELCIRIINQPNGGVSSARNAGLRAATGEYIALLDSDDEWLPEKTELQMEAMLQHPEIDYIGSNILNGSISILGRKKNTLAPIKIWELFVSWHPQTSTVLFKRAVLADVGYYNQQMTHGEDGEYLLRMCAQKSCWFMPQQLVHYDQGKPGFGYSGLSANLQAMQRGQMQILIFAYKERRISWWQFVVFTFYAVIKYWRRIVLSKLR